MKKLIKTATIALALIAFTAPASYGWEACKEAVASQGEGLMNGIESSIYFMLAMMFIGMPSAVIGGIAWECRKRTRLAESAAEANHAVSGSGDQVDLSGQVVSAGESESSERSL